jgi:hypothetical protein
MLEHSDTNVINLEMFYIYIYIERERTVVLLNGSANASPFNKTIAL